MAASDRLSKHLAGVFLLSGSVRSGRLGKTIKRSPLDLPIDTTMTVLDTWRHERQYLSKSIGKNDLPVRVIIDRNSIEPTHRGAIEDPMVSIERDPQPYRGTAGLLRDVADDYQDDDLLLVASGQQILTAPLWQLTLEMAAQADCNADVSLLSHATGQPITLMLIKAGVLRGTSTVGYQDFKEQALPQIAKDFDVRVVTKSQPIGYSTRRHRDYLNAIRHFADYPEPGQDYTSQLVDDDPFQEDWQASFAIVEPEAVVGDRVRIHDSVVLRGAKVMTGSVIVRSIIGPGATVGRGQAISDRLVAGRGSGSSGKSVSNQKSSSSMEGTSS